MACNEDIMLKIPANLYLCKQVDIFISLKTNDIKSEVCNLYLQAFFTLLKNEIFITY
jgi:hypothetical protein